MGTKSNPSKFDCYSRAEPDEPVFVLLGRDPVAPVVVDTWANLRQELGEDERGKLAEARACAAEMARWAKLKGKELQVVTAYSLATTRGASIEDLERIHELEALCRRAADAVELLCSIKREVQSPTGTIGPIVTAVESVEGEELAQLVKGLKRC